MTKRILSGFQVKALNDLGLALVDWNTDRTKLPAYAKAVASIVGCTTEDLFYCLRDVLCSLMSMKRELDVFGLPMIDIAAAKELMREPNIYGGWLVEFPDGAPEPKPELDALVEEVAAILEDALARPRAKRLTTSRTKGAKNIV